MLCPRECHLKDGQRGFCFVRQNIGQKLILTSYGLTSGLAIDPIEKKPLNHFFPGSTVLSFGAIGCNLSCTFCQNYSISRSNDVDRLTTKASPEEIAISAQMHGCTSVAFTYNEPIISAEFVIDTAKECHKLGIKTIAVTAGYISKLARQDFFEHIDAVNIDLKAFNEDFYQRFTGGHLDVVLESIEHLKKKTSVWFEITNLIIPQCNDSLDEISDMCSWIMDHCGAEVPLHFSAFHPDYKMLDRNRTPMDILRKAKEIATEKGLKYVYLGNVADKKHASTFCYTCQTCLIERDSYTVTKVNLIDGKNCPSCGTPCDGIF